MPPRAEPSAEKDFRGRWVKKLDANPASIATVLQSTPSSDPLFALKFSGVETKIHGYGSSRQFDANAAITWGVSAFQIRSSALESSALQPVSLNDFALNLRVLHGKIKSKLHLLPLPQPEPHK
ncbi:hypothetical protein F442_10141 [Phytophthora nicotianae P10297]|uniref:Uncharacterized protein n=1 Tax=Phytophthora nicotianae P10297 TaxID=1317064 RepID=W2Z7N7_PHYNI|nr:hypothetical protein F442_10141 [Phytophthora nicotianae P10297]